MSKQRPYLKLVYQAPPTVVESVEAYLKKAIRTGTHRCFDCVGEVADYMVTEVTWAKAFPTYKDVKRELVNRYGENCQSHVFLCFKCLETRLGRMLEPDDFDFELPINHALAFGIRLGGMLQTDAEAAARFEANFTGGWMAYTTRMKHVHHRIPAGTAVEVRFYTQVNSGKPGVEVRVPHKVNRQFEPIKFRVYRNRWYFPGLENVKQAVKTYQTQYDMSPF